MYFTFLWSLKNVYTLPLPSPSFPQSISLISDSPTNFHSIPYPYTFTILSPFLSNFVLANWNSCSTQSLPCCSWISPYPFGLIPQVLDIPKHIPTPFILIFCCSICRYQDTLHGSNTIIRKLSFWELLLFQSWATKTQFSVHNPFSTTSLNFQPPLQCRPLTSLSTSVL